MPPLLQRIAGGRCGERKENSEKGREKRTRQAAIFARKSPPALVRVVIQNFLKKPVISTVFKADE